MLRGIVFDLDGTLVESYLDFDAMRREMELPAGLPILETLAQLPREEALRCEQILHRHERAGVERALLMPGAAEFLAQLREKGFLTALITRNSRLCTLATLARFDLHFDTIVSRDDAPAKPNPAGILRICADWGVEPREIAMLGDYLFDLQTGRHAGAYTILFARSRTATEIAAWAGETDFLLDDFEAAEPLWQWIESI